MGGLNDWIEIFRTGRHVDSAGDEKEWTPIDLDHIVQRYNPKYHEAPVVIGHPEDNAPAFGWVQSLKREGNILYAKLKNLVPEFVNMVERGLFKKRSMALYPDSLTLRHIGFLGATPPAVKGLKDVYFEKTGQLTANFREFEFEGVEILYQLKGGMEMKTSKERDPGKELQRRINAVLQNPPQIDRNGQRFSEGMTYSRAFTYVQEEDPELTREYAESLCPKVSEKVEKALAAGNKIASLVEGKRKVDKSLSYSEALNQVQKENRELILEYMENLRK